MEQGQKRAQRREAFAGWAQLWGPALGRPLPVTPGSSPLRKRREAQGR